MAAMVSTATTVVVGMAMSIGVAAMAMATLVGTVAMTPATTMETLLPPTLPRRSLWEVLTKLSKKAVDEHQQTNAVYPLCCIFGGNWLSQVACTGGSPIGAPGILGTLGGAGGSPAVGGIFGQGLSHVPQASQPIDLSQTVAAAAVQPQPSAESLAAQLMLQRMATALQAGSGVQSPQQLSPQQHQQQQQQQQQAQPLASLGKDTGGGLPSSHARDVLAASPRGQAKRLDQMEFDKMMEDSIVTKKPNGAAAETFGTPVDTR